jgi:hypothetical protein
MKLISAIAVVVSLLSSSIFAGDADLSQEVGKETLRSLKREIVAMNIVITDDAKAKIFWDIYSEFEADLMPLNEDYIESLEQYATKYDKMSSKVAESLVENSIERKQARLKLVSDTYEKMAKEVSPIEASRFVQLDNRISLMVELGIVLTVPMILPEGVSVTPSGAIVVIPSK